MEFENVKAWLQKRNHKLASKRHVAGIVGVILFPFGLSAAVGCLYLLMVFLFQSDDPRGTTKFFWIAIGCVPLMFLGNRFMPRRDATADYMENPPDGFFERRAARYKMMWAAFCWTMFTGPRLLDWALSSFRESTHLKQHDPHDSAAVLWVLMSRINKVPLAEFPSVLDWLDVNATLPEVRQIAGVLVLKGPPPALSLTTDLRNAIRSGNLLPD
jgi:hypothetical protein